MKVDVKVNGGVGGGTVGGLSKAKADKLYHPLRGTADKDILVSELYVGSREHTPIISDVEVTYEDEHEEPYTVIEQQITGYKPDLETNYVIGKWHLHTPLSFYADGNVVAGTPGTSSGGVTPTPGSSVSWEGSTNTGYEHLVVGNYEYRDVALYGHGHPDISARIDDLQRAVAAINSFRYESVQQLPPVSQASVGVIYLVPSSNPETQNIKDEYILVDNGQGTYFFEQIGSTAINIESLYIGGTHVQQSAHDAYLWRIKSISAFTSSTANDLSCFNWNNDYSAWRFRGSIYSEASIVAGVPSSGSGTAGSAVNWDTSVHPHYEHLVVDTYEPRDVALWGHDHDNMYYTEREIDGFLDPLNVIKSYFVAGKLQYEHIADLYVGRTRVLGTAQNDTLLGINAVSNAASSGSTGDATRFDWNVSNTGWHFYSGIYADGFVVAGAPGQSSVTPSGSSVSWEDTTPPTTGYKILVIDDVPTETVAVLGHNHDSRYYTQSFTDILLAGKQNTISDLSDIRDNASHGNTTYGYFTSSVLDVTHGGTGLDSVSKGSILYASAANTISELLANGTQTKKFLAQTNDNAPAWTAVSITNVIGSTAVGSASLPIYYSGSAFATISSLDLLAQNTGHVKANRFYLNANTYVELDTDGYVHLTHPANKGFYVDGFVASGIPSSNSSGTGTDVNWDISSHIDYGTEEENFAILNVANEEKDVALWGHIHADATTSASGFMPSTDKTKLDGIAATNNTTNKLYIIGATAQTGSLQTYSSAKCYIQGDYLYSNNTLVATQTWVGNNFVDLDNTTDDGVLIDDGEIGILPDCFAVKNYVTGLITDNGQDIYNEDDDHVPTCSAVYDYIDSLVVSNKRYIESGDSAYVPNCAAVHEYVQTAVPANAVFTDTWRPITVDTNTNIGNNNLNLVGGTNISLGVSNGSVTISSTYNYTLPLAANGTRGGIQIGFSESNSGSSSDRNYALKLSSEKAYVNVPWSDTTNTAGAGSSYNTKLFLVGTTSQTDGIQSYSNTQCYIGNDNNLYSGGALTLTIGNVVSTLENYNPSQHGIYDVISSTAMYNCLANAGTSGIPVYFNSNGVGKRVNYLKIHPENSKDSFVTVPFTGTDISFFTKRGGVLTYSGITTTLSDNAKASLFDGKPTYCLYSVGDKTNYDAKFTLSSIENVNVLEWGNMFYIDFGNAFWAPTKITVHWKGYKRLPNDTGYDTSLSNWYYWDGEKWVEDTNSNTEYNDPTFYDVEDSHYTNRFECSYNTTYQGNQVTRPIKLSVVDIRMYGYETGKTNNDFRIAEIGILNYNSNLWSNGFMSRGTNDDVWRDISPAKNNTYKLGYAGHLWSALHVKDIYFDYYGSNIYMQNSNDPILSIWGTQSDPYGGICVGHYSADAHRSLYLMGKDYIAFGIKNDEKITMVADYLYPSNTNGSMALGSGSHHWGSVYARRWIPDYVNYPTALVEFSGANSGFHFSYGIYSDSYVSAGGVSSSSDIRLKDNIRPVDLTLSQIAEAPAVEFEWKKDGSKGAGSIAQYWQNVLPHNIHTNAEGMMSLEYGNIALLSTITVAKEVERLKARIVELENRLNA